MEIRPSDTPAAAAGVHITQTLSALDGAGLCLLSGGSALEVIPYLRLDERTKGRTIFMMVDERVSGEGDVNNFLQLQSKYPGFVHEHLVIDTGAEKNESPEHFAARIQNKVEKIFSKNHHVNVVALLGMGADGHTAGIFPMDQKSFEETYPGDSTYVPVHLESLTIDSRASFTPDWIQKHAVEIIGYVTGESKSAMLSTLTNEVKPINEMPAQILKNHKCATVYTDIELPRI